jgi:putative ATPase
MKEMGYGKAYQYSHDGEGHFIEQEFLPEALSGTVFFTPGDSPREQAYAALIRKLWKDRYEKG